MTLTKEVAEKSDRNRPLRSIAEVLAPLDKLAIHSINLVPKPFGSFECDGAQYQIPRYLFVGPKGGGDPIRVALVAGVHGDEPEGTFALVDFAENLEQRPELARDYCLFFYPLINPTGFERNTKLTAVGANIAQELWSNSTSPEVQALQSELWMHAFDGIVSFRTDPRASELTVAVGGSIFFRHLLGSALSSAQDLVPQVVNSGRDALPGWRSVLLDAPNELIRAAPGLKHRPFEVVITLPSQVPLYLAKSAVSLLLRSVLSEYRNFIAYGANI